jgi:lysophospholipase L1-like esterase
MPEQMNLVKPLLLLLGDSLIDYGEWHRSLHGCRIISSGVPGERSRELLHRLSRQRIGDVPDIVVLMSGTNDLLSEDPGFTAQLEQAALSLRQRFPDAAILLTSLLPLQISMHIPGLRDTIVSVNRELKALAKKQGCHYFDLFSHFEQSDDDLFDFDGVHLNNRGYRLWARELERYVTQMLAPGPG